uniref:Protein N-lysine methyltransferase METTL21A n=1 Tax=Nelumbo nucifera TaxID=4432 RepID=A0A822ZZP8_NELNU|nr:TPA_asm: hypothetical protein HUJ06_018772 [Nelumbo nucifera]
MDADRLNSPNTSAITLEVLGHQLQFSQDPNSKHLGTTVWDASMVLVKFLEKNCRKGKFCPSKLKGKRVIELGAGCGVAGFGMALLGCDVVSTDQIEVLPLLMRNVERNTSRIMQTNADSASFGSIQVAELDWGNQGHIKAVDPPFDYIIGTDVVYAEHLLEPLLQTILALSGPKTTVLLGYEIRSSTVHEKMLQMWKSNFEVKTVPRAKMDSKYQHASIQLFIMGLKPQAGRVDNMTQGHNQQSSKVKAIEAGHGEEEDHETCCKVKEFKYHDTEANEDSGLVMDLKDRKQLSDWEARRSVLWQQGFSAMSR